MTYPTLITEQRIGAPIARIGQKLVRDLELMSNDFYANTAMIHSVGTRVK